MLAAARRRTTRSGGTAGCSTSRRPARACHSGWIRSAFRTPAAGQVLEPLVAVEAAAVGADLRHPRPHLVGGRVDLDAVRPAPARRPGRARRPGSGRAADRAVEPPGAAPSAQERREQRRATMPHRAADARRATSRQSSRRQAALRPRGRVPQLDALHEAVRGRHPARACSARSDGEGTPHAHRDRRVLRASSGSSAKAQVTCQKRSGRGRANGSWRPAARVEQAAQHQRARRLEVEHLEAVGAVGRRPGSRRQPRGPGAPGGSRARCGGRRCRARRCCRSRRGGIPSAPARARSPPASRRCRCGGSAGAPRRAAARRRPPAGPRRVRAARARGGARAAASAG